MVTWYVVKPGIVRQSLVRIREAPIHPHFSGYLCLKKTSVEYGRDDELPLPAKEFFDQFWRVPDLPERRPYLYPFIESQPTPDNAWFNKNVAGSYAPSSLRENQPFVQVVEVEGSGRDARFSLKDRHWQLARRYLCHDQRISAIDLAVILYRDYGISSDSRGLLGLVDVLRDEFGLQDEEFEHLYVVDGVLASYQSVFETIEEVG